jgi:hypothetical protein
MLTGASRAANLLAHVQNWAVTAEVVELAQQRDQRVAGGLRCEIVDVASREPRPAPGAMPDVKPRLASQALVEVGDRPATDRLGRMQAIPP